MSDLLAIHDGGAEIGAGNEAEAEGGTGVASTDNATATVVICAYTEDRWADLRAAVASAHGQLRPGDELLLVIDHNPDLLRRAADLDGTTVVANQRARGLSGARNTAVDAARGDLVVFLDDDAVARPGWLDELRAAFADPTVAAAGGTATPAWAAGRPRWFPEEFNWVVGCTYVHDVGGDEIRNPLGCNMAFRRSVFDAVGGFREDLGRIGTHPVGCEETELSIRLRQALPGQRIVMRAAATVDHHVPDARGRWSYFARRCYAEGLSKASVTGHVGRRDGLSTERAYALVTLPKGVLAGARASVEHRDLAGASRAGAIVAGLAMTAAGFGRGRLARLLAPT